MCSKASDEVHLGRQGTTKVNCMKVCRPAFFKARVPGRRHQSHQSSSQVFKAVDRLSGQEVALKRIFLRQPELGIPSNVLREYKALQLLHDDRLVKLLDVFPSVCLPGTTAPKATSVAWSPRAGP